MSSPPVGTGTATSSPPPPTLTQISLPPGMTLPQFESMQGSLVTIAITVAAAFGALIWDYFNLLPNEIRLYRTSSKYLWRSPATWAFIVLRYSGIVAMLPSLFFTSVQTNYCEAAVLINSIGVLLVVASTGIIFCYRVFAIWGGNPGVCVLVGNMYLIVLGSWIIVSSHYGARNGPPTLFGSNCQMLPIISWAPISYASSVAFDAVILLLTVSKFRSNRATASQVGYRIYRDSLMYFLLTAATHVIVLVIQSLGPSYDPIKPTVVPFSTLITATMGARVFLNLNLFNRRQEQMNQRLPFVSTVGPGTEQQFFSKPQAPAMTFTMKPPVPTRPYPISLSVPEVRARSDSPFAAYDLETPKANRSFEMAHFTRETVVIVE